MNLISKAKGGKSRYVPILPQPAQEFRTRLGNRTTDYLFETVQRTQGSTRRIQRVIKEAVADAQITNSLRHSVATTLLGWGMPNEQIQRFPGHSKSETTQSYAESSAEMIKRGIKKGLAG